MIIDAWHLELANEEWFMRSENNSGKHGWRQKKIFNILEKFALVASWLLQGDNSCSENYAYTDAL